MNVTDRNLFRPVKTGICLLYALRVLYPGQFMIKARRLDELIGARFVRRAILRGDDPIEIAERWKDDEEEFVLRRKKYLLYR